SLRPDSSDTYTTWRPSGDGRASNSLKGVARNTWGADPSPRFWSMMSFWVGPDWVKNTVRPSRDQVGLHWDTLPPATVCGCAAESAAWTSTSQFDSKTRRSPPGAQEGCRW